MATRASLTESEPDLFGPGTDLVLSLVAVMVLFLVVVGATAAREKARRQWLEEFYGRKVVQCEADRQELEGLLAAKTAECEAGQLDIALVRANQRKLALALAAAFFVAPVERTPDVFELQLDGRGEPDIVIENDATLQKIRFGSHVLFDDDRHELKPGGRRVMTAFASVLAEHLAAIGEIQIQGHADIRPTRRHESNFHLAAKRAIEVLRFMSENGIRPTEQLMSASSFGEFSPVARRKRSSYSESLLEGDNDTPEKMRLNRRIEIVLVYRRAQD